MPIACRYMRIEAAFSASAGVLFSWLSLRSSDLQIRGLLEQPTRNIRATLVIEPKSAHDSRYESVYLMESNLCTSVLHTSHQLYGHHSHVAQGTPEYHTRMDASACSSA